MRRITGTLHTDICTFMTISFRILLKTRNAALKRRGGNQNTYFMFSNIFPKFVSVWRQCAKLWYSQKGHR